MNITQEDINSLAAARGVDRPDQQWILTPFDTWEKNPFYHGEDQVHPEIDFDPEEVIEVTVPVEEPEPVEEEDESPF